MILTLRVTSYKGQPPSVPLEKSFDHQGGTIGRLPENGKDNLLLPDPERYISREHAIIKYEEGHYYLTDTSVDGTYLLNKNSRVYRDTIQLNDGDRLRIGDYDLIVQISVNEALQGSLNSLHPKGEKGEDLPAFGFSRGNEAQVERDRKLPGSDPNNLWWIDKDDENRSERNTSDKYLDDSPIHDSFSLPDVIDHTGPSKAIPENYDFEELINQPDGPDSLSEHPLPNGGDPSYTRNVNQEYRSPIDDEFHLKGQNDISGAPPEIDESVVHGSRKIKEHVTGGLTNSSEADRQQGYNELIRAFLKSAGIEDINILPQDDISKLMLTVGAAFREMVAGLMTILRGRSEIKTQFRVSATNLKPSKNNPLKFSRDVDEVLKLLLTNENPGFVEAIDAVREGFADIMEHQIAMTAGMQTAIIKIIERFDPKNFSEQFEEGVIFQKKAKSWDVYSQSYPDIVKEVLENFVGESFARAYEEQIRKLRAKTDES